MIIHFLLSKCINQNSKKFISLKINGLTVKNHHRIDRIKYNNFEHYIYIFFWIK